MSAASAMAKGRARAEALMTDTCRVKYKTGNGVQNETTGVESPTYVTRFDSACKFQTSYAQAQPDVGGRRDPIDTAEIHLPADAAQVHEGDVIECLTSATDSRLVGRLFVVGSPMNKTYATATRLSVKELP